MNFLYVKMDSEIAFNHRTVMMIYLSILVGFIYYISMKWGEVYPKGVAAAIFISIIVSVIVMVIYLTEAKDKQFLRYEACKLYKQFPTVFHNEFPDEIENAYSAYDMFYRSRYGADIINMYTTLMDLTGFKYSKKFINNDEAQTKFEVKRFLKFIKKHPETLKLYEI